MLLFTLYLFIVVVAIQLVYYLIVFGKFAFAKAQKSNPKKISVSVIVCAKNEGENVAKYVPLLAEQDYPDFEVIVIKEISFLEVVKMFFEHLDYDTTKTEVFQTNSLSMRSKRKVHFQVDGEYLGMIKNVDATVMPNALQIIVPNV